MISSNLEKFPFMSGDNYELCQSEIQAGMLQNTNLKTSAGFMK
jgi:hypothetical protein